MSDIFSVMPICSRESISTIRANCWIFFFDFLEAQTGENRLLESGKQ